MFGGGNSGSPKSNQGPLATKDEGSSVQIADIAATKSEAKMSESGNTGYL